MKSATTEALFCVGVKIIVRNPDHKILLLKFTTKASATCSCPDGCWELPGGRIQVGENEITAVYREMHEETGITHLENLHPIRLIFSDYKESVNNLENIGYIFSMFHANVQNDTVILSDDHVDYAWVDEDKAIELLGNAYHVNIQDLLTLTKSIKN